MVSADHPAASHKENLDNGILLSEIKAVKEACHGKLLKVIIECCFLTDEEKTATDCVTVNELLQDASENEGGCPFYHRCHYAGEKCLNDVPALTDIGTPGHPHYVRCERIEYGEKYTAAD